jgi:hypothetical protein
MKIKNSVNILGTEYKIIGAKDTPKLKEADGYVERYAKEIVFDKGLLERQDRMTSERLDIYHKKVMRHEIIHAFFYESGNNHHCEDEELVDCLAILIPKIVKAMKEVNVL